MAKRLTRARQKITRRGIATGAGGRRAARPARRRARDVVPGLQRGVRREVRARVVRAELVDEAIRLGRLLLRRRPTDAGDRAGRAHAVAALRRATARRCRRDHGAPRRPGPHAVGPAADRRGVTLVGEGLPAHRRTRIATSCRPRSPPATRWRRRTTRRTGTRIVSWYDVLLTLDAAPVARLIARRRSARRDGAAHGARAGRRDRRARRLRAVARDARRAAASARPFRQGRRGRRTGGRVAAQRRAARPPRPLSPPSAVPRRRCARR